LICLLTNRHGATGKGQTSYQREDHFEHQGPSFSEVDLG
jgi:hypothetical protein